MAGFVTFKLLEWEFIVVISKTRIVVVFNVWVFVFWAFGGWFMHLGTGNWDS